MQVKRQIMGLAISSFALMMSAPVYSLGILDAYSLALEKDPLFQAAIKEKEAGNENENIGRAGLLPKVSLNYQNAPRNWQTQKYQSSDIFGNVSDVTKRQQYRSYTGSVTLTQSIFDYEAYAKYKSGVAQSLMADEKYRSKYLDLAVRVISAYVGVAYAKDQIALAQAQKDAYKEQLALNDRLVSAGEGTITDVAETQARYSLAEAQLIEARDVLDAAQRELEVIIGIPLDQLDDLQTLRKGKFQVSPLPYTQFVDWEKVAMERNPQLAASRHGVDAARYDVERNRSGFMPQVQLYASHSENDSSSDNTVNQKYRTDSIGVQVTMPIYSGGGVAASTRQAAARYGQAKYELDAQVGDVINDLRKQFNLCISSQAKLIAYDFAVKSATTQVEATRKSVLAGQRVNVDVLNAEQQLYGAQRDLAEAKYTYIKAWISLLSDSGTLNEKNISHVASYFDLTR
ncbi:MULTISPECIES: TolC family outer membrane protein [Klebsiella pneumoniae complex]|uniref:TolC family outer membrane protein n=1 Tax=Klebsiella pneumoniae complex TaxID=3390273 RepID=UPI000C7D4DA7|nr:MULTISPECIES: TolC family outer membrane protein [Klebsiella]MCP6433093.1 TolC family outer membrane protein [Klebsiella pneumoniae]MCU6586012.1 TolC family outer membrane protein [Klebsiella pneumoniae]MDV0622572.1 TolC family outer membrane protein [Klebsiella variicola subsp. variicola]PLC82756.1 peptidase [Klebsiella pneumoniae]HBW7283463.1 TolC family outer membrane protein [Klebsiella pneumoniae]